ncbi:MAG: GDP-mannose 4,6-dehydratase [Planctomycetes bacterium]|nr:GDP-mannose 4,6-dehydratase [Planctomycetota bacterium]
MSLWPLPLYAFENLFGKFFCSFFYRVSAFETFPLRYFNFFGPQQAPKSKYAPASPAFVTAILKDEPPVIYGDGRQSRDFTYVDNVVQANLLAARAKQTKGEVINIACGLAVTVNEIIAMINDATGNNVKPNYAESRPGDVKHSLADITLAEKTIGFKPKVTFSEGLQKAIEWYRENLV